MSNWNGTSRTNYFHCDRPALEAALAPFDLEVAEGQYGTIMIMSTDADTGSWPSFAEDDDGQEIEFSFEEFVMPHVAEGEVVITMSAGAEKMRYVSGYAEAYIRQGGNVKLCAVSLNDIYNKAAIHFNVEQGAITACEY